MLAHNVAGRQRAYIDSLINTDAVVFIFANHTL